MKTHCLTCAFWRSANREAGWCEAEASVFGKRITVAHHGCREWQRARIAQDGKKKKR